MSTKITIEITLKHCLMILARGIRIIYLRIPQYRDAIPASEPQVRRPLAIPDPWFTGAYLDMWGKQI